MLILILEEEMKIEGFRTVDEVGSNPRGVMDMGYQKAMGNKEGKVIRVGNKIKQQSTTTPSINTNIHNRNSSIKSTTSNSRLTKTNTRNTLHKNHK